MANPCVAQALLSRAKPVPEKTAQDIGFEICLILMHTAYALSSHRFPTAADFRPTAMKTLKRDKKLARKGLA
jgi:hypothetical protein